MSLFISTVEFILNPHDEKAFLCCIPTEQLEPFQRNYLANLSNDRKGLAMLTYLRNTSKSQTLKKRIEFLQELIDTLLANDISLPCFVSRILQKLGLKRGTKRIVDGNNRSRQGRGADDVERALKLWQSRQRRQYNPSLRDQLVHFTQMVRDSKEICLEAEAANADAVFIGTIHKAKGREFTVVFLIEAGEDNFNGANVEASQSRADDERRLIYVAASRAKILLFISFTGAYSISTQRNKLSSFFSCATKLPTVQSTYFPLTNGALRDASHLSDNVLAPREIDEPHGCGVSSSKSYHENDKNRSESQGTSYPMITHERVSFFSYTKRA